MVIATGEQTITVGLGDVCVSENNSETLACYGIGSCIGLCVYDPVSKIAGMAHIVLPERNPNSPTTGSTKFADIAVPALIEEMRGRGAVKSRLIVKLVGGAQMIQARGFEDILEMGTRNTESTKRALTEQGIRIAASDTGGGQGRSVWLSVGTGSVFVRAAGKPPKEL